MCIRDSFNVVIIICRVNAIVINVVIQKKLSWGVVIAAFFLPVATSYNFVDYSIVVFCIDVINERFLSAIWAKDVYKRQVLNPL